MHNNNTDAYLTYFMSQPRMPAPAAPRRTRARRSLWTRKVRAAR